MLIRQSILPKIKSGEVTLAFRCWRRPTVKSGSTLTTAVGVLTILHIDKIDEAQISETDARKAGYSDKASLLQEIGAREGELYRIELTYAGADPRVRLCEQDKLTDAEFAEVQEKLQRLDAASRQGRWTIRVLKAIAEHPMKPAIDLANDTGFEKAWLKTNVRKLKNMGLTISHNPGYNLSQRGKTVLDYLRRQSEK